MAKITNYNFKCDLSPVKLWQYSDAKKLQGIIDNQQAFMDTNVKDFFENLRDNVFNLTNADSFGLSIWGSLLGVPRPSYTSGGQTVYFTDEQYRLLLRARIYLLTFDGSARALNEFFHILFPDLVVTVKDNGDMTAEISILNEVDPEIAILFHSPFVEIFLPRPSGVAYNMSTEPLDLSEIFGFEGMTDGGGNSVSGFDNGVFAQG